jgi:hypothetical protein
LMWWDRLECVRVVDALVQHYSAHFDESGIGIDAYDSGYNVTRNPVYELFVYGRIKKYLRNEKIRPGIDIICIQTRVRFVIHGCTRTLLVSQCECMYRYICVNLRDIPSFFQLEGTELSYNSKQAIIPSNTNPDIT